MYCTVWVFNVGLTVRKKQQMQWYKEKRTLLCSTLQCCPLLLFLWLDYSWKYITLDNKWLAKAPFKKLDLSHTSVFVILYCVSVFFRFNQSQVWNYGLAKVPFLHFFYKPWLGSHWQLSVQLSLPLPTARHELEKVSPLSSDILPRC